MGLVLSITGMDDLLGVWVSYERPKELCCLSPFCGSWSNECGKGLGTGRARYVQNV